MGPERTRLKVRWGLTSKTARAAKFSKRKYPGNPSGTLKAHMGPERTRLKVPWRGRFQNRVGTIFLNHYYPGCPSGTLKAHMGPDRTRLKVLWGLASKTLGPESF